MNELMNGNVQTMDSREIANLTEKRHADVCRDIRTQLEAQDMGESKFASSYITEQNKEVKCYELDYEQTLILLSGYSIPLRAKVIKRWQDLESNKILSPAELMVQQSQILLAQEKELIKINSRLNEVEAKQLTIDVNYYSIIGWCRMHNIKINISEANSLGRLCAKASRERGISIDKIHDPRFGQINAYHKDILTEIVL